MELKELHVRELGAGPIRHRDSVAGRYVGIGGVEIDLPRTARSEHRRSRKIGLHLTAGFVEHVGTHHSPWAPKLGRFDEVDRHVVFGDVNVGRCHRSFYQDSLDFFAGDVACVDDAPSAVTAFSGEIERQAFFGPAELRAEVHQLANPIRPVSNDHLDDFAMRKPTTSAHGVVDVSLERIGRIENGGDTALCPVRRRVRSASLRDHRHTTVARCLERKAQACHSTPKHQVVALCSHEPGSLTGQAPVASRVLAPPRAPARERDANPKAERNTGNS